MTDTTMGDHIYDDIIFNLHQQILDEEESKRKPLYDDLSDEEFWEEDELYKDLLEDNEEEDNEE